MLVNFSWVEADLRDLEPQDPMHRQLSLTIPNQFEQLMSMRWKVIEEAHNSISTPFYIVLAFWLVIVFASFGLSAPRNLLSYITIMLGALSIASVTFCDLGSRHAVQRAVYGIEPTHARCLGSAQPIKTRPDRQD
jgi:hypothetical protein